MTGNSKIKFLPGRLMILLIAGLLSWNFARAEEGAEPKPPATQACEKCKGTGRAVFKEVFAPSVYLQENLSQHVFCEECIKDLKYNYGLNWKPCPACADPAETEKYQKHIEDCKLFMQACEARRKKLNAAMSFIQTRHFYMGWNITKLGCTAETRKKYKMPPSPAVFNLHECLHVYAFRAEDAYDVYQKVFNVAENAETIPVEVYWLTTEAQKETVVSRHEHYTGNRKANWCQSAGNPTMWDNLKENQTTDEQVKFKHVHTIGEMIHDRFNGHCPLFPPTFTTTGFGHFTEIALYNDSRVFDFTETEPAVKDWGFGNWRSRIYKQVEAGHMPSFPELLKKNIETLGYRDHAFCFAYVDFLIHYDQAKWIQFSDDARMTKNNEESLMNVYQWSPLMFEEMFKNFILKCYPRSSAEEEKWVYDPKKLEDKKKK